MIEFFSENDFQLPKHTDVSNWIQQVVEDYGLELGDISYVFCSDEYLLNLNQEFLDHDTYTDIISFDYRMGDQVNGEIYISTDRVKENANLFEVEFITELHRVIIHGVLHFCGFKDKSSTEKKAMRNAENDALAQRSFV